MALLNKAKVTFSVILSVKIYVKHNKKNRIVACSEQLVVSHHASGACVAS